MDEQKLEDLIAQIFEHKDAPKWLKGGLHDLISDHSYLDAFDPELIRVMLKTAIKGAK